MTTSTREGPLGRRMPHDDASAEEVLDAFLAYVNEAGLELYPAQEEAILALYEGKNVILATPTGSGKSLVALALHFLHICRGHRVYATTPIKALASQQFFTLAETLCPEWVGMSTGDASVNAGAYVVCCTAEVLANVALAEGAKARVDAVVMDEFHYYADKERGVAWQLPLLALPQAQFLLMSATLGDTRRFEERLSKLTDRPTVTVSSEQRPVPLDFLYAETPLQETVEGCLRTGKAPVYLVSFTQRGAGELAQSLMSVDVATKDEKRALAAELKGFRFDSPYGKVIERSVRHGIGIHHAGLLPKYRLLVERLAQKGMLKVISGTDTLGVGVNVPIRTVLFTQLCKYDGEKTALLSVRDFRQVSGRAGRRGYDDVGYVIAQAPEHVIENKRIDEKIAQDPSKKKKLVRRKPPERGYVPWDEKTFEKLRTAPCEPLVSSFKLGHGMLLEVALRPEGGGCYGIGRLIRDSDEAPNAKKALAKRSLAMMGSMLEAGVLLPTERAGFFTRSEELQLDFSMHQALSLFLLGLLPKLQELSEAYALDVLSAAESIVENPDVVLVRMTDKKRTELYAELKAEGVPFEEREERLREVSYDKPLASFLYESLGEFERSHPWVAGDAVRPKGIVRAMVEGFYGFNDFVRAYGLERAEGVLLRYLSEVYKVLAQTVPPSAKTEELDEIEQYLRVLIRSVDSSLLDEWERMRTLDIALPLSASAPEPLTQLRASIVDNEKAFLVLVRNACFAMVRAIAEGDDAAAAEILALPDVWTPARLASTVRLLRDEQRIVATARARAAEFYSVSADEGGWTVYQELIVAASDGDEPSGWRLRWRISRQGSADAGVVLFEDFAVEPS